MRPGQNDNWAKRLSDWESGTDGPLPGDGLWDRLDRSLHDRPARRRVIPWWCLWLGQLIFIVGAFFLLRPSDPLDAEGTAETATELEMVVTSDPYEAGQQRATTNPNTNNAPLPVDQSSDNGNKDESVATQSPGPSVNTSARKEISGRRRWKPQDEVDLSTGSTGTAPARPDLSKVNELPPQLPPDWFPATQTTDRHSASATVAVAPLYPVRSMKDGSELLLQRALVSLMDTVAGSKSERKFTKQPPAPSFGLHAGGSLGNYRVTRQSEVAESLGLPRRIWSGYGAYVEGEVHRGRWSAALGLQRQQLDESVDIRRVIRIERDLETVRSDGSREGQYALDLKSLSDEPAPASLTVRRRDGAGALRNPLLRLELKETSSLDNFVVPLSIAYEQPLWRSPFSLKGGVGLSHTWSTYRRSVSVTDARFLNGVAPEFFSLEDRAVERAYNFWSYTVSGGVGYRPGAGSLRLGVSGTWSHSLGDWAENRPQDRWLQGMSFRVGVGYLF